MDFTHILLSVSRSTSFYLQVLCYFLAFLLFPDSRSGVVSWMNKCAEGRLNERKSYKLNTELVCFLHG